MASKGDRVRNRAHSPTWDDEYAQAVNRGSHLIHKPHVSSAQHGLHSLGLTSRWHWNWFRPRRSALIQGKPDKTGLGHLTFTPKTDSMSIVTPVVDSSPTCLWVIQADTLIRHPHTTVELGCLLQETRFPSAISGAWSQEINIQAFRSTFDPVDKVLKDTESNKSKTVQGREYCPCGFLHLLETLRAPFLPLLRP
jgi:hypothetical protein